MKILKQEKDGISVRVTIDELTILNNALNEVLNGIDGEEFATRMGQKPEAVELLLAEVGKMISGLRSGRSS
jgi:hypothetical protein